MNVDRLSRAPLLPLDRQAVAWRCLTHFNQSFLSSPLCVGLDNILGVGKQTFQIQIVDVQEIHFFQVCSSPTECFEWKNKRKCVWFLNDTSLYKVDIVYTKIYQNILIDIYKSRCLFDYPCLSTIALERKPIKQVSAYFILIFYYRQLVFLWWGSEMLLTDMKYESWLYFTSKDLGLQKILISPIYFWKALCGFICRWNA